MVNHLFNIPGARISLGCFTSDEYVRANTKANSARAITGLM